jgi:hypothetical protein
MGTVREGFFYFYKKGNNNGNLGWGTVGVALTSQPEEAWHFNFFKFINQTF